MNDDTCKFLGNLGRRISSVSDDDRLLFYFNGFLFFFVVSIWFCYVVCDSFVFDDYPEVLTIQRFVFSYSLSYYRFTRV